MIFLGLLRYEGSLVDAKQGHAVHKHNMHTENVTNNIFSSYPVQPTGPPLDEGKLWIRRPNPWQFKQD